MPASHMDSGLDASCSTLIWLPANSLGEAMEDSPRIWDTGTHVKDPTAAPGSRLQASAWPCLGCCQQGNEADGRSLSLLYNF